MRGILLLALGVVLIWFGIRTSGGPEGAGASGSEPGAEAELGASLAEGSTEEAGGLESDPAQDPARADGTGADAERDAGKDTGPSVPAARSPQSEVVPRAGYATPRVPAEPQNTDETFELSGPLGDRGELGELLLGAWIRQDPAPLEEYLNQGAGRDLPAAQRRLLVAFWQAAVGEVEEAAGSLEALRGAEGTTTLQLELLRSAVSGEGRRALLATRPGRDPIARAMRMVLLETRAAEAAAAGERGEFARCYSELVQLEIDAPWPPHRATLRTWGGVLNRAQAHHRLDPNGDWPSIQHVVSANENLILIRKQLAREHPALRVSAGLLTEVNDLGKYIHPGNVLRVPTEPANVIVDLGARIAIYRHGSEAVLVYEVGIGMEGHETPTGTFVVGEKLVEPSHMPEGKRPLPYGDPDNPLGTRWIGWYLKGQKTSYGFHGTEDPNGVGGRVSKGCVRLRNAEVEQLFELLPLGSQVTVRP